MSCTKVNPDLRGGPRDGMEGTAMALAALGSGTADPMWTELFKHEFGVMFFEHTEFASQVPIVRWR